MWVGSALGPLPLYLITVRPGKPYVCPVVRKIGSRELLTVIPVSEMKPVGSRDLIITRGKLVAGALALLVYEFFLTLDDEVEFIWTCVNPHFVSWSFIKFFMDV